MAFFVCPPALLMSGCETGASVASFRLPGFLQDSGDSGQAFSWSGATAIDVATNASLGSGANDDLSPSCTTLFGSASNGCMQTPALLESDDRWFVGFSENYLPTDGSPNVKYSAFVNMTSLATNLFATALGPGLGMIDTGSGLNVSVAASSTRYTRMAKLSGGDVVAVMSEERVDRRVVVANVYSAATNTWGTARELSNTAKHTDSSGDFVDPGTGAVHWAHFCRPSVAASGDGSAMVAWCEGDAASGGNANSEIRYTFYRNGAWTQAAGASSPLVDDGAAEYALPGIHGVYNRFPPDTPLISGFQVGDVASVFFNVDASTRHMAAVTAVANNPSQGQFKLVTDTNGVVQACETLENMTNAFLAVGLKDATTSALIGLNLSQNQVSAVVNPSCVQGDASTWRFSLYYNRGLRNLIREVSGGADGTTSYLEPVTYSQGAVTGTTLAIDSDPTLSSIPPRTPTAARLPLWERSAMVDVAGDGFGNYAMVRSLVSSTVKALDVSTSGVMHRGRMLVGHEYAASAGFKQRTDAGGGASEPATSFVSGLPECFDGVDTYACSVRNPKILMSSGGAGLVLFHQSQWGRPSGAATKNPTRLWFSTYSVGSGFSSAASILDNDLFCDSSSVFNDESVCETGQFGPYGAAGEYCMSAGEPATGDSVSSSTTHDVAPIAAAMNPDGNAVVAFHKRGDSSTSVGSCSDYARVHVAAYDPFNGWGDVETLDDDTGHTMHASVAISPQGRVAVAWETYVVASGKTYVQLRTKTGTSWSAIKIVNDDASMQQSAQSMMPAVGINDDGEVVVSFSYGASHVARRQYVNRFYYH